MFSPADKADKSKLGEKWIFFETGKLLVLCIPHRHHCQHWQWDGGQKQKIKGGNWESSIHVFADLKPLKKGCKKHPLKEFLGVSVVRQSVKCTSVSLQSLPLHGKWGKFQLRPKTFLDSLEKVSRHCLDMASWNTVMFGYSGRFNWLQQMLTSLPDTDAFQDASWSPGEEARVQIESLVCSCLLVKYKIELHFENPIKWCAVICDASAPPNLKYTTWCLTV